MGFDGIIKLDGFWALATGYWLHGYCPLAIGCWVLPTGYWLLGIAHWLLATGHCPLAIGYWALPTGYLFLGIDHSVSIH